MQKLKTEILEIAEYLGCNGEELWSEISKVITKEIKQVRLDELLWIQDRTIQEDSIDDIKESVRERLTALNKD